MYARTQLAVRTSFLELGCWRTKPQVNVRIYALNTLLPTTLIRLWKLRHFPHLDAFVYVSDYLWPFVPFKLDFHFESFVLLHTYSCWLFSSLAKSTLYVVDWFVSSKHFLGVGAQFPPAGDRKKSVNIGGFSASRPICVDDRSLEQGWLTYNERWNSTVKDANHHHGETYVRTRRRIEGDSPQRKSMLRK